MIDYNWDNELNDYIKSRRYYREYNALEQELLYEHEKWSTDAQAWIHYQKYESDYDEYGNTIEYIRWDWDPEINEWKGNFWRLNEYDEHGNMLMDILYMWSSSLSDWSGTLNNQYYFDNDGFQYLNLHYAWSDSTFDWYIDKKDFYFFRTNLGMDELTLEQFMIYPNPAKDYLYIKYCSKNLLTIHINDMNGRFVKLVENFKSGQFIDIKNLTTGMYIINISDGRKYYSKKILVQ